MLPRQWRIFPYMVVHTFFFLFSFWKHFYFSVPKKLKKSRKSEKGRKRAKIGQKILISALTIYLMLQIPHKVAYNVALPIAHMPMYGLGTFVLIFYNFLLFEKKHFIRKSAQPLQKTAQKKSTSSHSFNSKNQNFS